MNNKRYAKILGLNSSLNKIFKKKKIQKNDGFFKQKYFLSIIDENRMDEINDKMCLIHLEYHWVKTIFNII